MLTYGGSQLLLQKVGTGEKKIGIDMVIMDDIWEATILLGKALMSLCSDKNSFKFHTQNVIVVPCKIKRCLGS